MRVGVETPDVIHRVEVEPHHDLADPVAFGLGELLDLREAHALDPLGDHHPPTGQRGHDVRDVDERVAAVGARKRPLVLGLELVVELLEHELPHLADQHSRVEPRHHRLCHRGRDRRQPGAVPRSASSASAISGVLDLDRDLAPIGQHRAVDLPDRRRRDGVVLEVLEQRFDGFVPFALEDALDLASSSSPAPSRAGRRACPGRRCGTRAGSDRRRRTTPAGRS